MKLALRPPGNLVTIPAACRGRAGPSAEVDSFQESPRHATARMDLWAVSLGAVGRRRLRGQSDGAPGPAEPDRAATTSACAAERATRGAGEGHGSGQPGPRVASGPVATAGPRRRGPVVRAARAASRRDGAIGPGPVRQAELRTEDAGPQRLAPSPDGRVDQCEQQSLADAAADPSAGRSTSAATAT